MFGAMSSIKDIGTVIQVLRVVRGHSQGDLARRSKVRNSSISNYERGKAEPKFDTLQKLADGLELPFSAMEDAQRFIDHIRSLRDSESLAAAEGQPMPGDDLTAEADRIAQDAGRVVQRLVTFVLRLLQTPAGDRSVDEEPELGT